MGTWATHTVHLGSGFLVFGTLDWCFLRSSPALKASTSLGLCRRVFTVPAEAVSSFCPAASLSWLNSHKLVCWDTPGCSQGSLIRPGHSMPSAPRGCRKVCLLLLPNYRLRSTFQFANSTLSLAREGRGPCCQGQQLGVRWRRLLKWSAVAFPRSLLRLPVACWIHFSLLGFQGFLQPGSCLLCEKMVRLERAREDLR